MKLIDEIMSKKLWGQVNNLMMNCISRAEMFDHLIHIGLDGKDATYMASSYNPAKHSFSVIPLVERMQRKTYHCENGAVVLIEV